jgi:hypothetical protein
MINPEVGMPLMEALGGSDIALAATGASFCDQVLKACGFDVMKEAGFASPSAPGKDIASLVAPTAKGPSAPGL